MPSEIKRVVSSPMRSKLMMLHKVKGVWHKQLGGAPKVEAFVRSGIELSGNGIKFFLRELGEVSHHQHIV